MFPNQREERFQIWEILDGSRNCVGDEAKRDREMFPNQREERFQIREITAGCRVV